MTWRYFAQRLHGDGTASPLEVDLPLSDVSITKALSGHDGLSATVPFWRDQYRTDGLPLFAAWSTAIWAEESGVIRGGGILADASTQGTSLSIDCVGFTGYLENMPYTESWFMIQQDPLYAVRHIWDHVQGQPGGNLGLQIDRTTKTGILIGQELEVVDFVTGEGERVSFEAGPYKLNWWQTHNLGREVDSLAKDTPFDYYETHRWVGDDIEHRLHFAYPRIARRRHDLRFVLGENVFTSPSVDRPESDFVTQVLFLGAGEGRDMVHALSTPRADGRLRRVAVAGDKTIRSKKRAASRAAAELAARKGLDDLTEISVIDHPNAPLGSVELGDELLVQVTEDWYEIETWFRVTAITIAPADPEVVTYSVVRSDKMAA